MAGRHTDDATCFLSFRPALDFQNFIKKHMVDYQPNVNKTNELIMKSARVVGQEKDGTILFTWHAPSAPSPDKVVTYIGVYSPNSPSYRTVYTHEDQVEIQGASIDPTQSLLAFSTHDSSIAGGSYDSFVSEIKPVSRTFSLNLSSSDFRKVQFVSPPGPVPVKSGKYLSARLLVMVPDNWICYYRFNMEIVDRGYIVMAQPEINIVAKECPWYQWDPTLQWLFYARFMCTGEGKNVRTLLVFHVMHFTKEAHNVMLTATLPLPLSSDTYVKSATYYKSPLAFNLPVHELNCKLLYDDSGIWCLCIQHKDGMVRSSRLAKDTPKIYYTVYLLHKGHSLEGEVTLKEATPTGHHVQFMLIKGLIVAYVPGVMFHLLNVAVHSDPCHHLILDERYAPSLPAIGNDVVDPVGHRVMGTAMPFSAASSDLSTPVFDPIKQIFYMCSLELDAFVELFTAAKRQIIRESLLHLMLLCIQDDTYTLRMIERVCQAPPSLDNSQIFQEFLIGFSYANIRDKCKPLLLRHLPISTSQTYRGSVYKNPEGFTYAVVRCTEMENFVKQLLVQSDQKLVSVSSEFLYHFTAQETFEVLCYNAVMSQPFIYHRVSLESISYQVASLAMYTPAYSSSKKHDFTVSGSFVGKFKELINMKSNQGVGAGETLPFLLPDDDLDGDVVMRSRLLRDRITQVLTSSLKIQQSHSMTEINNVSGRYLTELHKSSVVLLHVIWQSLYFNNSNHPLLNSVHRDSASEEVALFDLLESYFTAHSDLGIPLPSGFATLFISIGYLCLEPSVFIQYLRNNVFSPTQRFVYLLYSQCDDVDDDFLYELFSFLSTDLKAKAKTLWKQPVLELFQHRDRATLPKSN